MNHLLRLSFTVSIPIFVFGLLVSPTIGQDSETPPHTHIQSLADDDLMGLVSLVGSVDGKFLYGAALSSKKLVTLSRDTETGKVEVIDSIGDLKGAVCLAISKDQRWVVLSCCQVGLVTMYSRNAKTGKLTEVSRQQQGVDDVKGLDWPIAVTISPDSKFVYVTNAMGVGSLTAFSIKDDKLKFLQQHEGVEGCMNGARLLAVDPEGEFLFVACDKANCLTVFDRDPEKGHVRLLHRLKDEDRGSLLAGAHGVVCSNDGKHLYVASGRFGGDDGISVFEILQRDFLELAQELESGKDLKEYKAGNHIGISPDGKYVYATAANSGNILCFGRDADSGHLKYLYDLRIDGKTNLSMTAGVYVSSDNRFVYVACEGKKKQLYVFERKPEEAEEEKKAKTVEKK